MHPAIRATTAKPPSHHVSVTLDVKQEMMRRIEPTVYDKIDSVCIVKMNINRVMALESPEKINKNIR